ncbi:sensor histidine kinase [Polaribacter pacificus]|nr:histidine kinase [Polaribacter pacificus]
MTVIIHVLFWVFIYFFYNYFLGFGSDNIRYVQVFSLYLMPVTMILSYFVAYQLLPDYLLKKKYKLFVLYAIYAFVFSFYAILVSIFFGLVFTSSLDVETSSPITKTLPLVVLGVYFVVSVVAVLSLAMYNYKSTLKNEDLTNKILQNQLQLRDQELRFLKMQIHPHFLFNSLNTIYGFALMKRDEAPEMILKLSNLLDYILYQTDKPSVALTDEIAHLKNYIALEKMRFHDTLRVVANFSNDNDSIQIAPMLLIPFLENSFKHGAIKDGVMLVDLLLETSGDQLYFKLVNSSSPKENTTFGIGLQNIKKRLELLYPQAFELLIENDENFYTVTLRINLTKKKNEVS